MLDDVSQFRIVARYNPYLPVFLLSIYVIVYLNFCFRSYGRIRWCFHVPLIDVGPCKDALTLFEHVDVMQSGRSWAWNLLETAEMPW